jgi:FkbM family methyltransferase
MGFLARQYRLAKVIFIEPHPRLAAGIATNIQVNDYASSCELIQAVVSDASGEIIFHEDLKRDGSHTIHPDPERRQDFHALGQMRCLTLQEIIETKALEKIHFLKIDTEGNDYAVLRGLGQYLQPSFTEILYVEMLSNQQTISDLLRSKGYIAFAPMPMKRQRIAQLQRLYERGERVAFFEPLIANHPVSGDVLWCGENSIVADYLTELHRTKPNRGG